MSVSAEDAYRDSMIIIRARFLTMQAAPALSSPLIRSEMLALNLRKIVEGVAFAALSALEYRNRQNLLQQHKKDADQLLSWMAAKNLLRLPQAETIQPSTLPDIKFVVEGAPDKDLTVEKLKKAYSLSSILIHERHPERIDREKIERDMAELVGYAERLQSWLWTHMMFFHEEAILVQMSMVDTPNFITQMMKEVLP